MKPRLGNAPRATPVAATSGANARQLGLGRVREMQPPGLASHAARSNHCGADRRTDAGSQGWKQPPGVVGAALDGLPGTTSAARQVAAHATRGALAPLVGLGPPASVETTVGPRFLYSSTVRLPGSNPRGEQPSLRIEADSPRRGGQARAAASSVASCGVTGS